MSESLFSCIRSQRQAFQDYQDRRFGDEEPDDGESADDPSRRRIFSWRRLLWALSTAGPPASGLQWTVRSFVDGRVNRRDVQISASTSEYLTRRSLLRCKITCSTSSPNGDWRELHEWRSSTGEGHHNTTRHSRSPIPPSSRYTSSRRHRSTSDGKRRQRVISSLPAIKEPHGLLRSDSKHPDGLTFIPRCDGRCATYIGCHISYWHCGHLLPEHIICLCSLSS